MSIWKLSKVCKLSKYIDTQQTLLSFRYFLSTIITKAQNLWVIKSSKSFEKFRSCGPISGWFLVRKPSRPQNVKKLKCDTWIRNFPRQAWLTVQMSSSVLRYSLSEYRIWIGLRRCLNHWTTLKAVSTSKIRKLSERSDFWAFCRLPMITLLISKSYQYLNVYSRNITKGICLLDLLDQFCHLSGEEPMYELATVISNEELT